MQREFAMSIVPFNSQPSIAVRPGAAQPAQKAATTSKKFVHMGCVYLIAAVVQAAWIYFLVANIGITMQYVRLPIFGWGFAAVWILMIWCSVHLFYIGCRLIHLSGLKAVRLTQDPREQQLAKLVMQVLLLGIVLDIFFGGLLFFYAKNVEWSIYGSALMGARILKGNSEAIFQYHRI
jgi:hypothetical protein